MNTRSAYKTGSMIEYNALCDFAVGLGLSIGVKTRAESKSDWSNYPCLSWTGTGLGAYRDAAWPPCTIGQLIESMIEASKNLRVTIRLSGDYQAVIDKDGTTVVGCQTIPFDVLESVYKAAVDQRTK